MLVTKSVKLALNDYPTIPKSLQTKADPNIAVSELNVDLSDLYNHYLDQNYGLGPNSNIALWEQVRYLTPRSDFRYQSHGLGITKDKRITTSREMGEVFCRWFLKKHNDVAWLATIDQVRGHGAIQQSGGWSVESDDSVTGNAPDYFCVTDNGNVVLAEAKGTLSTVGFGTKKWVEWRKQFNRVKVIDPIGNAHKVKGYIVATRWATEDDSEKIWTKIFAEDPETPGERPFHDDGRFFNAAVKSVNYVAVLHRLRQPILAAALADGLTIPKDWRFEVPVWECLLPALQGKRFVGGIYGGDGWPYYDRVNGDLIFRHSFHDRLDVDYGTFLGVEEKVFHKLVDTARIGPPAIIELRALERGAGSLGGASLLPDGKIIGPLEIFRPSGRIVI